MIAGFKLITGARRPGLDHHRSFEADEHVGNGRVVMPRNHLARAEGHDLHAHAVGFGDDVVAGDRIGQVFERRHDFIRSSAVWLGSINITPWAALVGEFDKRAYSPASNRGAPRVAARPSTPGLTHPPTELVHLQASTAEHRAAAMGTAAADDLAGHPALGEETGRRLADTHRAAGDNRVLPCELTRVVDRPQPSAPPDRASPHDARSERLCSPMLISVAGSMKTRSSPASVRPMSLMAVSGSISSGVYWGWWCDL